MPTLAERIVERLRVDRVPLDDEELGTRLGLARQAVNQTCRRLEQQRVVERCIGPNGKIVNTLVDGAPATRRAPRQARAVGLVGITEDEVKQAVKEHLESDGYTVTVAWGRERGIDIDARGPAGRLIIEAKAEVPLQPQQVNYFLAALGELVQRMNDADARYGLALPDNKQYRGLVDRLPALAKSRLGRVVFFVRRHGGQFAVDVWTSAGE